MTVISVLSSLKVDVVRDELWLVLVDELGQFAHRGFEFLKRSVAHLGGIDVDEWLGHVSSLGPDRCSG
jgi:hypothetical protein